MIVKALAITDEDGHWYVIPADKANRFDELLADGEDNEYEQFNKEFGQYATGGDLNCVQLYADL